MRDFKLLSVQRETRQYYLTTDKNPNGAGLLAVISLGSPQRGDRDVVICDCGIFKNRKAAEKWFASQMKTKPWQTVAASIKLPEGIGKVTGIAGVGNNLVAKTESGVDVPIHLEKLLQAAVKKTVSS